MFIKEYNNILLVDDEWEIFVKYRTASPRHLPSNDGVYEALCHRHLNTEWRSVIDLEQKHCRYCKKIVPEDVLNFHDLLLIVNGY